MLQYYRWYKAAYGKNNNIYYGIQFRSLKVLCARGSSWPCYIAQFLIHVYTLYNMVYNILLLHTLIIIILIKRFCTHTKFIHATRKYI